VKYNTYRPVYEQRVKEEHFTVQKPVYYEEQVPCTRTVMKPVYTTETRDIAETIYESVMEPRETVVRSYSWEPVCTEQQICVQTGSWRTEVCEIPGQVVMRKVCHPGFWTMDPCCCKMIYVSGHVSCSPVQLPNRTICKKNLGTQNGNSNHYLHELCAQGTLQCDSFLLLQNYTQNCLQKSMFHQMLHGA